MARHCPGSCEGVVQDIMHQSLAVTRPSHLYHAAVTRVRAGRAHPTQLQGQNSLYTETADPLEYPINASFYYKVGPIHNCLAMLGGTLQAQHQIVDSLVINIQYSRDDSKGCKSSQGRLP